MALVSINREAQARLKRDRFSSFVSIFCLISILAQTSLILVVWGKLPGQLPLFYSRPWGEAMLGRPIDLWILPAIMLVTLVVNYLVALFFVSTNSFLQRVLLAFSFLVALTTLYDAVKIISLLT